MAILTVSQIAKSFGAETILDDITFQVYPGERVGLVGPNGAGKTTLLRILTRSEQADAGSFTFARGNTLGYLEQSSHISFGGSMEQELRKAFLKLDTIAARMAELEHKMAESAGDAKSLDLLMESYGNLRHQYEDEGGYRSDAKLRSVTAGLGFSPNDLSRDLGSFSGGERTRVRLARLLLEEPDLLLLDEPTNHLDLSAVEWLENYLAEWTGSVMVVSHDRYFLDRVAGRILSLENNRVKSYHGNYSAYLRQKEHELLTQEKAYKKQRDYLEKETTLVRTAGTGEREKRQAKSREKKLAKVNLIEKPRDEKSIALGFGFAGRSGEIAARLEGVAKSFSGETVFDSINLEIRYGDRLALVGPNGAGKTTLLKVITGEIEPDCGSVWLGPSVKVSYFDQHQTGIAAEGTPLSEIMAASGMNMTEARTYLGRFLFSGDDVYKNNHDLSGGEKSRLSLAKLGLDEGNFLILDEPTNHLDISAVEELEKAITGFAGTLLVVSHDRYFISRTTTKVLQLEDGEAVLYKLPYAEYIEERQKQLAEKQQPEKEEKKAAAAREREEKEKELARRRARRKLEQEFSRFEEDIAVKEELCRELEQELADPAVFNDFELARNKGETLSILQKELQHLYEEWERLGEELDQQNIE